MRPFPEVLAEAAEFHRAGQFDQAAFLYEHLVGAVPDDPMALYCYGSLLGQTKRFGSSICLLEKATRLDPSMAGAWHNLGVAYRNEGHRDLAIAAYEKADQLEPSADAKAMISGAYVNAGMPETAEKWARQALASDPSHVHAINNLALALLEQGKYTEGWQHYANRWNVPEKIGNKRDYTCPLWNGLPVKKLAIHGEQGIGDEILFMSLWNKIPAISVVIECTPRLVELFERSFGVACYPDHDSLIADHPDCDAYIPMGDLPRLLGLPDRKPYLEADPDRVAWYRDRLKALGPGPYVGIAWHGGTKGTHQELRNAPLDIWKAFVSGPATFVSLQYGEDGPAQSALLGIPDFYTDNLDDFAALVVALDAVATVCQSAVHFAGALGTECWVAVPNAPAWRYRLTGSEMDWYGPHVRLFRQMDTWETAFTEMGQALADYSRVHRGKSRAA